MKHRYAKHLVMPLAKPLPKPLPRPLLGPSPSRSLPRETNAGLFLPAVTSIALALAIAGCSNNDDQDEQDFTTIADPAVSGPAPTMPAPGSSPDDVILPAGLDGRWSQDCMANDSSARPYSTSTFSISFDSATLTVSDFTDSACTGLISTSIAEQSLLFSTMTSPTSLGEAMHVEITNEQTNATRYDLLLIINDSLYLGDTSGDRDGSAEDLRPTQLDQTNFYVRETSGN